MTRRWTAEPIPAEAFSDADLQGLDPKDRFWIIDDGDEVLASVSVVGGDEAGALSAANLIAAAPDLLSALMAVVEQFGPWHDDECPGDDTCSCSAKPIHDRVNAAVARAEGRS